jgi:hypothetical protein
MIILNEIMRELFNDISQVSKNPTNYYDAYQQVEELKYACVHAMRRINREKIRAHFQKLKESKNETKTQI